MDSFEPGSDDWERDKRIDILEIGLLEFKTYTMEKTLVLFEKIDNLSNNVNKLADVIFSLQSRIKD